MARRYFFKLLFCLLLLCSVNVSAIAAISESQAASIAQQQFQGRVLAVSAGQQQSREVYKVKILDKQGEVHIVIIDAESGAVISAH